MIGVSEKTDLIDFNVQSLSDFPILPARSIDDTVEVSNHSSSPAPSPTEIVSQFIAIPLINALGDDQEMENEFDFGSVPIPRVVTPVNDKTVKAKANSAQNIPVLCSSYRNVVTKGTGVNKKNNIKIRQNDVNFEKIFKKLGKPVKNMDQQHEACVDNGEKNMDSELFECVKKRTKRFYLGGFLPSVTKGMIAAYVNRRGPKVTFVQIFHNRKYNSVVVRLNIEDNTNAALVEDPYFWPYDIICKPWVSHNRYKSNSRNTDKGTHHVSDHTSSYKSYTRWGDGENTRSNGFCDYNLYENLNQSVD